MSPPLPAMTHIQDRTYIPASAHQRHANHHSGHDEEEEHYNHDAAPPTALEEEAGNNTTATTTGIRSSQPSSSSSSQQQDGATASPYMTEDDDLEMKQTTALAAASLHATLPAWAVAALQETLEQPWKAHFDASGDIKAAEPDFGEGRDPVPFYDGRLKVCYGEGSMAA